MVAVTGRWRGPKARAYRIERTTTSLSSREVPETPSAGGVSLRPEPPPRERPSTDARPGQLRWPERPSAPSRVCAVVPTRRASPQALRSMQSSLARPTRQDGKHHLSNVVWPPPGSREIAVSAEVVNAALIVRWAPQRPVSGETTVLTHSFRQRSRCDASAFYGGDYGSPGSQPSPVASYTAISDGSRTGPCSRGLATALRSRPRCEVPRKAPDVFRWTRWVTVRDSVAGAALSSPDRDRGTSTRLS